QHQGWYCADDGRFCHPAFAVASQVVHHFAAPGRVADMNRIFEVEMCGQRRQVVGVMIHVMAIPGLAGTPVTPSVVSNHAIAALAEEQHLRVPTVRRERPAVTKDDGLTFAPILVVDLCSILRCDRAHVIFSFFLSWEW